MGGPARNRTASRMAASACRRRCSLHGPVTGLVAEPEPVSYGRPPTPTASDPPRRAGCPHNGALPSRSEWVFFSSGRSWPLIVVHRPGHFFAPWQGIRVSGFFRWLRSGAAERQRRGFVALRGDSARGLCRLPDDAKTRQAPIAARSDCCQRPAPARPGDRAGVLATTAAAWTVLRPGKLWWAFRRFQRNRAWSWRPYSLASGGSRAGRRRSIVSLAASACWGQEAVVGLFGDIKAPQPDPDLVAERERQDTHAQLTRDKTAMRASAQLQPMAAEASARTGHWKVIQTDHPSNLRPVTGGTSMASSPWSPFSETVRDVGFRQSR